MKLFKHAESKRASILKCSSVKLAEMSIQERISQAIKESGQTKSAIAKACGVNPSAVTQWLNGDTKAPTAERLLKLARATRVSYTWLVDGKGPMHEAFDPRAGYSAGSNELQFHDTEIVEGNTPLSPDEVELPCFREVEFSAGDGRTQVVENGGHTMRFPLAKLAARSVSPENAACATATGTSMMPTIADGSPIAIDKGTRHIIDGKIYALDHGGMLRIKRLYKLPLGRVRLVSDNSDEYPEETHSLMGPDAPKIIGRVFWWEVFD
ncbi:helix-turn-helix transcriptional regulator [Halomonas sp. A020]|uniref:helix-turn-helix transcriptional regulator n=1 Tax=Halomonas sp. A020 TaxID=2717374 RepID=UPI00248F6D98|nr:helix-turn-helix transcriptional regulator [Halomonas sp. A020]